MNYRISMNWPPGQLYPAFSGGSGAMSGTGAANQYSPAHDDLDEPPPLPVCNLSPEDRELLELAARAIGCVRFEEVEGEGYANLHFADGSVMHAWNPLAFSGDALELAVKLRLGVNIASGLKWTSITFFDQMPEYFGGGLPHVLEHHESDPLVATRRAITRAAAEIGKKA